ncbi:MAG: cytochrome C oxidase subunit IV family protein [Acidobacteriota bacterium]
MSSSSDSSHSLHIEPISTYLGILGALIVLTVVTVLVAYEDFGHLNDVVAVGLASTKATLVITFFMHARHATRAVKWTLALSIFFLVVMFVYILMDYYTRGLLDVFGK